MSREIKFRAWDKKLSKWIEGADGFHILGESMLIGGLFQNYLTPDIMRLNDIELMQFTGLLDKNGKEIYEGDIVKCHDHPTGVEDITDVVVFGRGVFRVRYSMIPSLADFGTAWVEVIGNVYENPELLNKDHTP